MSDDFYEQGYAKPRPGDVSEDGEVKGGFKTDANKIRTDLLPPRPILDIAEVLTKNCKDCGGKYPARNWEEGMDWSRPYGAILRHIFAWWLGEDIDPDSGLHHLAHAGCNLFFLLEYLRTHPERDPRAGC